MIKIWSRSGKRAVKKSDTRAGFAKGGGATEDIQAPVNRQNIIDIETLLSWSGDLVLKEAVGNETNPAQEYAKKRSSLKFLTL